MNTKEFKSLLERSDDKVGIFALISDPKTKLQLLIDDEIAIGLDNFEVIDIIHSLDDDEKKQLLGNSDFIEKHKISTQQLEDIIISLSQEFRAELLTDNDFIVNTLHLTNPQIAALASLLPDEDLKLKMLEIYPFQNYLKVGIIRTLSTENKLDILLGKKLSGTNSIVQVLSSFDIESLCDFLLNHKDFCTQNNIRPYNISIILDSDSQKHFVEKLECLNLTLNEKREILATLSPDTKLLINTTDYPEEYKIALSMQILRYDERIIWDPDRNVEDYRGLDNLMQVNPEQFDEKQKAKFMRLCDVCPNMEVANSLSDLVYMLSTVSEYKEAEEWISSLINSLEPSYSNAQKIALIDNALGKKISFSPDAGTEVFSPSANRALWKIICSGYGVCNGIAKVEQYILNKVGIESELVSSSNHAFLKVKNIELPLADGRIVKGNTILDPTWNLASHRFDGMPNTFCVSYEEIRKQDIDENGKDHNCHKNNEKLKDATLGLDEKSLRNLFSSVGLANKIGMFPISTLFWQSQKLDEFYSKDPSKNISAQLKLLARHCPDFAVCQNSSMKILNDILLTNKNLKFNECIINRVYSTSDEKKSPILYVYIDSNEIGKKFYLVDKNSKQFVEFSQEEFTQQFECYEQDLKSTNGIRPWESEKTHLPNTDLAKSSGRILANEGEER